DRSEPGPGIDLGALGMGGAPLLEDLTGIAIDEKGLGGLGGGIDSENRGCHQGAFPSAAGGVGAGEGAVPVRVWVWVGSSASNSTNRLLPAPIPTSSQCSVGLGGVARCRDGTARAELCETVASAANTNNYAVLDASGRPAPGPHRPRTRAGGAGRGGAPQGHSAPGSADQARKPSRCCMASCCRRTKP